MARMISKPGIDIYGRYHGSPLKRAFLTSDINQLPKNMAATSGAMILTIVANVSTSFSTPKFKPDGLSFR